MSNPSSLLQADAASAVAEADVSMLDAAALGRLRDLDPSGDNRVMERVMRAFESSLAKLLAQAEAAQASHDHAAMRHVAHTLKSSSASVGALELSRRCAEIEMHLREHRHADLAPHVRGLRAEGGRVMRAVQALLTNV
jgi:HPt (histidine-containing phosphotransfer) domain-containing protein